jgi:hypothetical protein
MASHKTDRAAVPFSELRPAMPLWRVAPTRGNDGRGVADFMMLIPRLAQRSTAERGHVEQAVREVCESYQGQVVFADINYRINVLWISTEPVPGLAQRVARSVRDRVPDALLVGGQLGAATACAVADNGRSRWRNWLRKAWSNGLALSRIPRPVARLRGPGRPDNAPD